MYFYWWKKCVYCCRYACNSTSTVLLWLMWKWPCENFWCGHKGYFVMNHDGNSINVELAWQNQFPWYHLLDTLPEVNGAYCISHEICTQFSFPSHQLDCISSALWIYMIYLSQILKGNSIAWEMAQQLIETYFCMNCCLPSWRSLLWTK